MSNRGYAFNRKRNETIKLYVSAYTKLLAPGGIVFLKQDIVRRDDQYVWFKIKKELLNYFHPLYRYIQVMPMCPVETLKYILRVDGRNGSDYLKGSDINTSALPYNVHFHNKCDAYLHTEWLSK